MLYSEIVELFSFFIFYFPSLMSGESIAMIINSRAVTKYLCTVAKPTESLLPRLKKKFPSMKQALFKFYVFISHNKCKAVTKSRVNWWLILAICVSFYLTNPLFRSNLTREQVISVIKALRNLFLSLDKIFIKLIARNFKYGYDVAKVISKLSIIKSFMVINYLKKITV